MYTGVYKRENFWEWWNVKYIELSTKVVDESFAGDFSGCSDLYWWWDGQRYCIGGWRAAGGVAVGFYGFNTGFSFVNGSGLNIADIYGFNEVDEDVVWYTALLVDPYANRYVGYVDLGPTGKKFPLDEVVWFPSGELLLF